MTHIRTRDTQTTGLTAMALGAQEKSPQLEITASAVLV